MERMIIGGDFNGYIGKDHDGFDHFHIYFGYGHWNPEGIRICDLCVVNNVAFANISVKPKLR